MNNEKIILEKRIDLMYEGIIDSTGELMKYQLPSGDYIKIPEPIEIHTKEKWIKKIFKTPHRLKEGEQPIATFKIWKPYSNKNGKGLVFKPADFYTIEQFEESEE